MKASGENFAVYVLTACCLLLPTTPAMANPISGSENFAIITPPCLLMEALLVAFLLSGYCFRGLRVFSIWMFVTVVTFSLMILYISSLFHHIEILEHELSPMMGFLVVLSGEILVIISEAWVMTVLAGRKFMTYSPLNFPMSISLRVSLYGNCLSLFAGLFISSQPTEKLPAIVLSTLGLMLSIILIRELLFKFHKPAG
jgi:hypothetical protein